MTERTSVVRKLSVVDTNVACALCSCALNSLLSRHITSLGFFREWERNLNHAPFQTLLTNPSDTKPFQRATGITRLTRSRLFLYSHLSQLICMYCNCIVAADLRQSSAISGDFESSQVEFDPKTCLD